MGNIIRRHITPGVTCCALFTMRLRHHAARGPPSRAELDGTPLQMPIRPASACYASKRSVFDAADRTIISIMHDDVAGASSVADVTAARDNLYAIHIITSKVMPKSQYGLARMVRRRSIAHISLCFLKAILIICCRSPFIYCRRFWRALRRW